MKIYKYDITLDTQLGLKKGSLIRYAEYNLGTESGCIEILGEKNPYLAHLEPDGRCSMSGTLRTIVKDHSFRGKGYIYADRLELTLYAGNFGYKMQGVLKEVITENEEVL